MVSCDGLWGTNGTANSTSDTVCINRTSVCDGLLDCPNYGDELDCGKVLVTWYLYFRDTQNVLPLLWYVNILFICAIIMCKGYPQLTDFATESLRIQVLNTIIHVLCLEILLYIHL